MIAINHTVSFSKRNPAGNPVATVKEDTLQALLVKGFLKVYYFWTWMDFKKADTPTTAHHKVLPPSLVMVKYFRTHQ